MLWMLAYEAIFCYSSPFWIVNYKRKTTFNFPNTNTRLTWQLSNYTHLAIFTETLVIALKVHIAKKNSTHTQLYVLFFNFYKIYTSNLFKYAVMAEFITEIIAQLPVGCFFVRKIFQAQFKMNSNFTYSLILYYYYK